MNVKSEDSWRNLEDQNIIEVQSHMTWMSGPSQPPLYTLTFTNATEQSALLNAFFCFYYVLFYISVSSVNLCPADSYTFEWFPQQTCDTRASTEASGRDRGETPAGNSCHHVLGSTRTHTHSQTLMRSRGWVQQAAPQDASPPKYQRDMRFSVMTACSAAATS